MNPVMKSVIKSYARGVVTAITPLIAIGSRDVWAYVIAVFAGVIGPAIRSIDKNDPAFGMIADGIEAGIKKAAKKSAKKAVSKKKTK